MKCGQGRSSICIKKFSIQMFNLFLTPFVSCFQKFSLLLLWGGMCYGTCLRTVSASWLSHFGNQIWCYLVYLVLSHTTGYVVF